MADHSFTVPQSHAPERLDQYLAIVLNSSRSRAAALLRQQLVTVNNAPARASYLVQPHDIITMNEAPGPVKMPPPDLPIVYEDDDLIVVNKPAGVIVHAANATHTSTVADFARTRSTDPDPNRPGIVHRLDRDTSGLLIIAKNPAAKAALQQQFRNHAVAKTYLALVVGAPSPAEAVISLPLDRDPARPLRRVVSAAGRPAVTRYKTLAAYPGFSLLEAKPQTGRTHQLRVHLASLGHPIAGDIVYGLPKRQLGLTRHFLHAASLEFVAPNGRSVKLESPLPPDLTDILRTLENQV